MDNLQAPWIGNDDYGLNDSISEYDLEYELQDDDRDSRIYDAMPDDAEAE